MIYGLEILFTRCVNIFFKYSYLAVTVVIIICEHTYVVIIIREER